MESQVKNPRRRRARQGGQEIMEFGMVAIFFVPLIMGTFVAGMGLIKSIQANMVVQEPRQMRDLGRLDRLMDRDARRQRAYRSTS